MGLLFENGWVEVLVYLVLPLWVVYWYLTKNYDYWEKRRVPNKKPEFPFGSTKEIALSRTFIGKAHDNIYKEFPNERFYGIIESRKPALVIKDPELIKKVLVKDFQYFVDRPVVLSNPKEYIMLHLLNLAGKEWKDMRAKLSPTFTSGKMKLMFTLMEKCGDELRDHLENEIKHNSIVDVKNILARFTLEIIASCAFGIETNSINEKNTEFFRIFGGVMKTPLKRHIKRMVLLACPSLFQFFHVNSIGSKLRDFVTNIVKDTIEYRQKNNVKRNDFLDLLISVKHSKNNWNENGTASTEECKASKEALTVEQIAAQTFVFFIAGFETASSLMSFCLYELSRHQDIQEKLFQDVKEGVAKNNGGISYQMLTEIPYLDQVINETLRLYGSAHTLSRICTLPYKVPDSDLVVEKGLKVIIPLFSLHHDPQYYPEPYAFKPERFSSEETKLRHPYVFMPFGEGPRNCIGMRFGLMQAKVGLSTIIMNFQVDPPPNQEKFVEIDRRSPALTPAKPVFLKIRKRESNY